MKLYHWKSEFFENCECGNVMVLAESLENARDIAMKEFINMHKNHIHYIDEFKLDLDKPPHIYDKNKAIIIDGSA